MTQKSLLNFAVNDRKIRADIFLEEMEKSIPWEAFIELISPSYYNKQDNRGRPKADLLSLLKAHFLQKWYQLSDLSCEELIHDRLSFRNFIDIDICETSLDATTIGKFRNFLEENNFAEQMFQTSITLLEEKGFILKDGTSVDATIIHAPSSTKNKEKKRDTDMSSTKKNNNFHFGMKGHIGVDTKSTLIHSVEVTTAKTSDVSQFENLLHGKEKAVFADKGYIKKERKSAFRKKGVFWGVLDKASSKHPLSSAQKKRNKKLSGVRAKVEHTFHTIKCLFGYKKTRYKGLLKNTADFVTLCMLANIHRVRRVFAT